MSKETTIEVVVTAMKAGAIEFLIKTFNHQMLLDSVNQALRKVQLTFDETRLGFNKLSPKEQQVIQLILEGKLTKQIACF